MDRSSPQQHAVRFSVMHLDRTDDNVFVKHSEHNGVRSPNLDTRSARLRLRHLPLDLHPSAWRRAEHGIDGARVIRLRHSHIFWRRGSDELVQLLRMRCMRLLMPLSDVPA